ncbi:erythrocyte membrane protein 1, PfEMP1, putative [Plasmodium reichenowi]|uniref:Erythrocyte membrane protein 1, PfEMP1, putative n=1 Tax=Plasmodium reichenowi TaxID=5854 RepID=A0A2P9D9Q0_PLARE|nr:erythrocyte membrane protein 1, PfEMP1, putative [Plasmodium reichenowi]
MAPGNGGGGGNDAEKYKNATDAKELFDLIGGTIQKRAHKEALDRSRSDLHGFLSKVEFAGGEKTNVFKECDIDEKYETNVTDGHSNPCEGRAQDRFSDTQGAECFWRRIRGSNDTVGACAPLRRLSLCDQNLEHIDPQKIRTTHNLYVDVLLAAKYEGEMIVNKLKKYDKDNYNSRICTELARSFADIGDIIRGKDLYRRDKEKKDKLETKLKEYFKKIYEGLDPDARKHYEGDNANYYLLREDWWELNRLNVWKAITCKSENAKYFRNACSNNETHTYEKCRCAGGTVPTYFDYVPQFLRWFEEWAEDFCRKKKKKLPHVRTNCRGDDENGKKYCSSNGYDCEETIYRIGQLVMGKGCTNCSVWCRLYESWIDNQKQEFLKQKNKYTNEISSSKRQKRSATKNYKGYDKEFYDELQRNYGNVDAFLKLLNNEKECTSINEEKEKIDFTKHADKNSNNEGTFYHSEYCKPCPICGVEKKIDGTFEARKITDKKCERRRLYKPAPDIEPTVIDVLSLGDKSEEIKNKIYTFCDERNSSNSSTLYDEWKCYYGNKDNEACILGKDKKNKSKDDPEEIQKSFNDFFNFWVGNLLSDTIHWRTQLSKCLNYNELKKCEKGCNKNCRCFKKWITQKQNEWTTIKEHFVKQTDIPEGDYYTTLELVLENYYLPIIKDAYGGLNSVDEMQNILDSNKKKGKLTKDDALDVLFKHEKDDADKCKETQEDCQRKKFKNPCSGEIGGDSKRNPLLAHKVAQILQEKAQEQLGENKSKLRAYADKGEYALGVNSSELNNVCNIKLEHSNRDTTTAPKVCNNKAEDRLKIGKEWSLKSDMSYGEVVLPPRREHMCTSNLEYLDTNSVGLTGANASDSLLGDVLLTAKMEGQDIKNKLTKNGDDSLICRALKYSFADIGDIIRGRDMWDKDIGEIKTQRNLQTVFGNIKKQLNGKGNYTEGDPYTKLRKDWWEANRDQVWNAMRCSNIDITCESGTPYDDYIPQRLRWMTEWAEWYCKKQYSLYDELFIQCSTCMERKKGTKCTQGTPECEKCTAACKKYNDFIKKWKQQWNKMKIQYITLYSNAGDSARTSFGNYPDKQQVVEFLHKLQEEYKTATKDVKGSTKAPATTPNTPYKTAEGYVHQELPNTGCQTQKEFCFYKNGVPPPNSTRGTPNDKYTFKETPHGYDLACKCKDRTEPTEDSRGRSATQPEDIPLGAEDTESEHDTSHEDSDIENEAEEPEESTHHDTEATATVENICNIVKTALTNNDNIKAACSQKYGGNNSRLGWKCIPTNTTATGGAKTGDNNGSICIPPRRRKMYVTPLIKWANGKTTGGGESVSGGTVSQQEQEQQQQQQQQQQQVQEDSHSTDGTSDQTAPQQPDPLLKAFVESAAVETFFLWHRYKKEWEARKAAEQAELNGGLFNLPFGAGSTGLVGAPSVGPFGGPQPGIPGLGVGAGVPGFGREPSESWVTGADGTRTLSGSGGVEEPSQPGALMDDNLKGKPGIRAPGSSSDSSDDPNNPENQLKLGVIPPSFLRQMFYTIADYRDILVGKTPNGIDEVIVSGSGDKDKEGKDASSKLTMQQLSDKIEQHIKSLSQQSGNNKATRVITLSTSGDTPSSWWEENAKDIWNGMICALTYEESEEISAQGTHKITQIENFQTLLDKIKKKDGKEKGEQEGEYHYKIVKLQDTSGDTKALASTAPPTSSPSNGTTLDSFVKRPPFFRYLEEWGENFCGTRQRFLKDVKKACREKDGGGEKYCGGDGHDCEDGEHRHNEMFAQLDCPGCAKQCRKYKIWIQKKEKEFNNQKSKYDGEREKLTKDKSSGGDNNCCKEIQNYDSAAGFLKALKHCKDDQSGEEKDEDKKNKLDFDDVHKTFSRSTYCKACPIYGVNYKRGNYIPLDEKDYKGKGGGGGNENDKDPMEINILVLGCKGNDKHNDKELEKLNTACKNTGLLEDTCVQKWNCQKKKNGIHECNINDASKSVKSQYFENKISFKILFQSWIIDFLEYYNKSKERITRCINDANSCKQVCNNKCDYVKQWLNKKEGEWEIIKNFYNENLKSEGEDIASRVKSFFQQQPFDSYAEEAKKVVHDETKRDDLWGCNDNLQSKVKQDEKQHCDFISNLIKKLKEKIDTCKTTHRDQPPLPRDKTQSPCGNTPTLVEDIDTLDDIDTPIEIVPGVCTGDTPSQPPAVPEVPPTSKETKKGDKQVEPKEDEICEKGKSVKCENVGKSSKIKVPMDPKNDGDKDRNNDGNDNKCGGIEIDKHGEWKTPKDFGYSILSEKIYVSPRRQKLCVKDLDQAQNETELKTKLLTVAANEGYNLAIKYNYYKDKYTVPPCHALKYSFYDYQHIILGDDLIENDSNHIETKLKDVFKQTSGNNSQDTNELKQKRESFWNDNKHCVWSAMQCGYNEGIKKGNKGTFIISECNDSMPTEFDGVPQFPMWFTEWSEDFCNQKNEQLSKLVRGCTGCTVTAGGGNKTYQKNDKECTDCTAACEVYKKWIEKWQGQYEKQKNIFPIDKHKYEDDIDVIQSTDGHEYLGTDLKNNTCNIGNTTDYCICMNVRSLTEKNMSESLEYPPIEIEGKCTCKPPPPVPPPSPAPPLTPPPLPSDNTSDILKTTLPFGIALALTSIAFLFLKKKTKSSVDMLRVMEIPQKDYGMPTKLSPNRYIPYKSAQYRGKRYIYLEGDSGTDSGYTDHYSDITSSSESEYEELDISDIYVPRDPKYKTLIEVVLEPSKRDTQSGNNIPSDIQSDDTPSNKFTDIEWNTLKDDFISQYLPNIQPNDVSNDYTSGNSPTNTNNTTPSHDNIDNNNHPTPSHHSMYQKPFIMSIHDRNLYTGEEYNYDMANIVDSPYSGTKNPTSSNRDSYSGIDLINDSLNSDQPIDIYDEVLKRKENELFGTNHTKNTSNNSVAKNTYSDPIHNQLDLLHKWLDRHRDMCEKLKNDNERLAKLKEEWENETHSGNKHSDIPYELNTDVSFKIDMDNPKPMNQFSNMDINPDKYIVDNNNPVDTPTNPNLVENNITPVDENPTNPNLVQIEMSVKSHKLVKEKYPIADVWDI